MAYTRRTVGDTALCSSSVLTGEPDAGNGRIVVQVAAQDSTNEEDAVSAALLQEEVKRF